MRFSQILNWKTLKILKIKVAKLNYKEIKSTMANGGKSRGGKKEAKSLATQIKEFGRDSQNFFTKCKKPDRQEYLKILYACAMGFVVMGFIGYLVKLVFIPINNIILSWTLSLYFDLTSLWNNNLFKTLSLIDNRRSSMSLKTCFDSYLGQIRVINLHF